MPLKENWHTAFNYCKKLNMDLAMISSAYENDLISREALALGFKDKSWWIAGNNLAKINTFYWVTIGQPLKYKNWGALATKPITRNMCIVYRQAWRNTWNRIDCEQRRTFVCQRRNNTDKK